MNKFLKVIFVKFFLFINILSWNVTLADNHNIYETLEIIKKDIQTLEKAVYSRSEDLNNNNLNISNSLNNDNSEDVLTRHLLKLNEIENQFQQLTNKFEEINFKLDKLSNRLSKVQSDNQIRFQDIESTITSGDNLNKLTQKTSKENDKILPGSSKPQELGSISYKDTDTNETTQQTQSINTTSINFDRNFSIRRKNFAK